MKGMLLVFVSIFLAELGDKTQVATLLFATDQHLSRLGVFVASSAALVCSSLVAVLCGEQLARWISPAVLKLVAGVGFLAIGTWLLFDTRA